MANVGSADRIVRAILGLVLIVAPFVSIAALDALGAWKFLVAAVGLVLLGTAAMRFCPLYAIFGLNTCPLERR
jgi:hypothetical protein